MDQVLDSVRKHIFQITFFLPVEQAFMSNALFSGLPQLDDGVNCLLFLNLFTRNVLSSFIFWMWEGLKWKIRREQLGSCIDMSSIKCRQADPHGLPGNGIQASWEIQHVQKDDAGEFRLGTKVGRHQPGALGCVDLPRVFSCLVGFFSSQHFAPDILLNFLGTCSQRCSNLIYGNSVSDAPFLFSNRTAITCFLISLNVRVVSMLIIA